MTSERGSVLSVDVEARTLTAMMDDGRTQAFATEDLAGDRLAHGYAVPPAPPAWAPAPTATWPVATSAGPIVLRHPGAAAVAPVVGPDGATYAKALSGGRDIVLAPTAKGFKETVVLHDAAAPAAYREDFVLPAGVAARDSEAGVEFVTAAGEVVATVANGWAFDASDPPGPSAMTPVAVRLATTAGAAAGARGGTVSVEVSIDPAFLASPERVFPVRVDPLVEKHTSDAGYATYVNSANPDANYYGSTWVVAGNYAGVNRTFLWFNLADVANTPHPTVAVGGAHIQINNQYSGSICTPKPIKLSELTGPTPAGVPHPTWRYQPPISPTAVSTTSFARNVGQSGDCTPGNAFLDATALAQRWLSGAAPNYGLALQAEDESLVEQYKIFYGSAVARTLSPKLWVNFVFAPTMAVPVAPAEGARVATTTPTLTVETATDLTPGDTVRYWFSGSPTAAGSGLRGQRVIESGWVSSPSYPVPAGSLLDGVSYTWLVWTTDNVVTVAPDWSWPFTVDLGLGAERTAPYDAIGPAQVNLASGNLLVGAGSPAGLGYAYNSRAPVTTGAATGRYFNDLNNDGALDDPVVMERRDPTIGFEWGTGGPGGGVWADNFFVRWDATMTVPATAPAGSAYTFQASADDGVRIWVKRVPPGVDPNTVPEVQVLDRWSTISSNANATAVPVAANDAVLLRVEYKEAGGNANAHIWLQAPYATTGFTPLQPSWLGAETGPLPAGWALSAGLAYASARFVDDNVVLTDASGAAHVYTGTAGGYLPPPEEDAVLALDRNGLLTLHTAEGTTYAFDAGGRIASATSPVDDPALGSATFTYAALAGDTTRLVGINDLGGRTMTLRYQGYDEAKPCPALAPTFSTPPVYALCQVDYWAPGGAVKTVLRYNAGGQLAQIEDPGDVASPATPTAAAAPVMTDFAYTAGLLSAVRSPLAHDAVKAAGVVDDDKAKTLVVHTPATATTAATVASVSLPVPNPGAPPEAPRAVHRYTYASATSTTLSVDGLTGVNRSVVFDALGRTTTDTDATGLATTLVWDDDVDHLLSVTDGAGRRTVTTYDGDAVGDAKRAHATGRPTQSYGPAVAADCFNGLVPTPTCATAMPHTVTAYDSATASPSTAWTGLAATYWATRLLTGIATERQPKAHNLADLSAGSPFASLPAGLVANDWSARYTGELVVTTAGAHAFALNLTGGGQLFVDDVLVVDATGNRSSAAVVASTSAPTLAVGRHRIRLDYEAPTAGTSRPGAALGTAGRLRRGRPRHLGGAPLLPGHRHHRRRPAGGGHPHQHRRLPEPLHRPGGHLHRRCRHLGPDLADHIHRHRASAPHGHLPPRRRSGHPVQRHRLPLVGSDRELGLGQLRRQRRPQPGRRPEVNDPARPGRRPPPHRDLRARLGRAGHRGHRGRHRHLHHLRRPGPAPERHLSAHGHHRHPAGDRGHPHRHL